MLDVAGLQLRQVYYTYQSKRFKPSGWAGVRAGHSGRTILLEIEDLLCVFCLAMHPASSFSWAYWNHYYVDCIFDILFSLWHCFYNHWTFWKFVVPPVCPVFFVSMRGVDLVDRFRTVWVAKNARPFGRKNGDFWDDKNPKFDGINLDKAVPYKGIFCNMIGVPGSSILKYCLSLKCT